MRLDPKRTLFGVHLRALIEDEKNEGLNCRGCLFDRQPAKVCREAESEAHKRGLRDCDAVDQFGDVAIYVRVEVDPRQIDIMETL